MNETTPSGRVLLVGSSQTLSTVTATLNGGPWSCDTVDSPRAAHRALRDDPAFDMVVLAPGQTLEAYSELCRAIKFDTRTSFISVICLLPTGQGEKAAELFDAGVDDCIRDGATSREMSLRLSKVMRAKQATDCLEDATAVVATLANAIEGKDHYTCGHVERVGSYCVEIGRRVGVNDAGLEALKTGGVVHDIGKVGIPDHVLNKPGKLTDEEMAIMRRHPLIGHDVLKPLRTFRAVLPIVRWHHERPNGTGYPDGLKGDELPLLPRIAAVADCFDALATDRPYRSAFPMEKCKEILTESGEKGDLDSVLVNALFDILDQGIIITRAA